MTKEDRYTVILVHRETGELLEADTRKLRFFRDVLPGGLPPGYVRLEDVRDKKKPRQFAGVVGVS